MKCIKTERYVFEPGDKELIRTPLPEDPCIKCDLRWGGCCGCPDGEAYNKALKPYKDRHILDLAKNYTEYLQLTNKIAELQAKQISLHRKLSIIGIFDEE